MIDTTSRRPEDAAQEPQAPEAQPGQGAQSEEARIAELVETLARENADSKDRLLRTLAEMENLRRRTDREVNDARQYGAANFARDVLAVADNMERALQALDVELRETADAGIKALLDGVELTERELIKVLEKHGVKKFEPQKGERFDPNLHQAMYEVPDPSSPTGTVAQVIQPGYMISERMLRPALVGVAKGGPKLEPKSDAAPPANDHTDTP
ncbi:MAG: nucleotide exchange factor GrpE [Xanthobacteraceae bacterium]